MAEDTRPDRFAVLIDADNTSSRIVDGLFEEIARFGEASVRRIYGDFSSPRLKSWTEVLQKHAIDPYQQFAYTSGKNASDIALVIDAMDLLHSGRFDGFCLVSSDSDFTRLASRCARRAPTSTASARRRRRRASARPAAASSTPRTWCRNPPTPEQDGGRRALQPPSAAGALAVAPSSRWKPRTAGSGWERSASGWPPSPRTSIRAATAIASSRTWCATPAPSTSTSPVAASCVFAPSRRGRPLRHAAAGPDRPPKELVERPAKAHFQSTTRREIRRVPFALTTR
jgi:hypothetical protein